MNESEFVGISTMRLIRSQASKLALARFKSNLKFHNSLFIFFFFVDIHISSLSGLLSFQFKIHEKRLLLVEKDNNSISNKFNTELIVYSLFLQ